MDWLVYLLIALLMLVLSLLFSMSKRNFYKLLADILYKQHNGELYLKEINSFKGKVFLNKKTRLFMSIDGYLLNNDINETINIFHELEEIGRAHV